MYSFEFKKYLLCKNNINNFQNTVFILGSSHALCICVAVSRVHVATKSDENLSHILKAIT